MSHAALTCEWLPAARDGLPPMAAAQRQCRRVARHIVAATGGDDPLIDLGAGAGHVADEVLAECGATPVCVEPDHSLAAQLVAKRYPVVSLDQLPDGAARGLYSVHAVSGMQWDTTVLTRAARKLAHGAPVVIYAPAFPALHCAQDTAAGHLRRYTRNSLAATLRAAGVTVLRTGYADSVGFMVNGMLRALRGSVAVTPQRARLYDACLYPVSEWVDPMARGLFGANVWAHGVRQ